MDDEQTLEVSVPLDDDGFLRRACPTCEREFKWFNSPGGEGEPLPVGGYFCPYCQVQGPPELWFTNEQVELATNRVARDIVGPEIAKMSLDLKRSTRGGLISLDMTYEEPDEMDPLVEPNDMRRVDFICHPKEPVKVLDDWARPVHCLICSHEAVQAE
jgi:hypothetical protein